MKLTILKTESCTILKNGRKTYAKIYLNPNPDYMYTVYFQNGPALSGYKTEQDAIDRANKMFESWKETISNIVKL
jgi:hypothetical protein